MSETNIILAEHPGLGRIRMCECEAIHVNVGPVTINLDPEAFAQLTVLMGNALDEYKRIADEKKIRTELIDRLRAGRATLVN